MFLKRLFPDFDCEFTSWVLSCSWSDFASFGVVFVWNPNFFELLFELGCWTFLKWFFTLVLNFLEPNFWIVLELGFWTVFESNVFFDLCFWTFLNPNFLNFLELEFWTVFEVNLSNFAFELFWSQTLFELFWTWVLSFVWSEPQIFKFLNLGFEFFKLSLSLRFFWTSNLGVHLPSNFFKTQCLVPRLLQTWVLN